MITYILCSFCFCEIWALCVLWITYDHFYYAPCLVCWALFGSLVPAMCNHTSCAQVHELPRGHCGDNWEGTLFSWQYIYMCMCVCVCVCVCVCMCVCVWSQDHERQCAFPVITCSFVVIDALGRMMHWAYELLHNHCGDNREGTLLHVYIYITPILLW